MWDAETKAKSFPRWDWRQPPGQAKPRRTGKHSHYAQGNRDDIAAEFSLMMLANTPEGDAYTFLELERTFRDAGFRSAELHEIPPSPQRVLIGGK
jgi:hypothetical protein